MSERDLMELARRTFEEADGLEQVSIAARKGSRTVVATATEAGVEVEDWSPDDLMPKASA